MIDTVGYNYVKIFDTPGYRNTSRDYSRQYEHAVEYALATHSDAEITVLHIVGEASPMMGAAVALALEDDIADAAEEHASQIHERAQGIAQTYGRDIDTDVTWGSPARAIIDRAADFDTVVVGSHGGSLAERLLVGNVAQTVFRRSPVPVTVVRYNTSYGVFRHPGMRTSVT